MSGRVEFSAGPEDVGERLDVVLARRSQITRARSQRTLRSGSVTVNGVPSRPSYRLEPGDEVSGEISAPAIAAPVAEDIPVTVRYSDDRLLVISKPPGLVTHPAAGHTQGTLVNALLGLDIPLADRGSVRPGIVHRLDKDTSGLLLIAGDDEARAFLVEALRDRKVERRYLGLVRGRPRPPSGTVDAPVGRHPVRRKRMAVVPEGRASVTHYRVLEATDEVALLDLRLETGRTHQIRVHLAHLGHPIVGDGVYGGRSELSARLGLTRPFLHAWRLTFPHPDGRTVTVKDPLPPDLLAALGRAGLPAPEPDP